MLCWESFFRKPEPTDIALIWLAGVAVACCALPTHAIRVASPPLPYGKCAFAFVFPAFAARSFLQILCSQRLPIDAVATPDYALFQLHIKDVKHLQ